MAQAVEYVTEAFSRIENMIDVMLVLTRGREAVGDSSPLSLAGIAQDAWDEVNTPEATLQVEIDEVVQADESYIRHLFRNLFENAVQHGGADVTVQVGKLDDGFCVADDGVGIPANYQEVVFDAGFTTAANEGGTGLGLAFEQELAEVYEWTYRVAESTAGGVQFEFTDVDFNEQYDIVDVNSDNPGSVDDPDLREQYAAEAQYMADIHDPDDVISIVRVAVKFGATCFICRTPTFGYA